MNRHYLTLILTLICVGTIPGELSAQNQAPPPAQPNTPPPAEGEAEPEPEAPPPTPDEEAEFQALPTLEQKALPSLERLLKGPAIDWVVLIRDNKTVETEPVSPRPNTLEKLREIYKETLRLPLPKVGVNGDESARDKEKQRRRDLQYLTVHLMKEDEEEGEFRIPVRYVQQIIHYEDLILKRIDLLLNDNRLQDAYELLRVLRERAPTWPGLNDRRDRLEFTEGVQRVQQNQLDLAWGFLERVQRRNAEYPELRKTLGKVTETLIATEIGRRDYRQARYFLERLRKCYSDHEVVTAWTNKLSGQAREKIQQATSLEKSGQWSEAITLVESAANIWPHAPELTTASQDILTRHQRLHVGVLELASGANSSPAVREREQILLRTTLFEPQAIVDQQVRFQSRFVREWEPTELGRSILFRLHRRQPAWEGQELITASTIVNDLTEQIRPGSARHDERLANYIRGAQVLSPFEFSLDFQQAPLKPEPVLNVPIRKILLEETGSVERFARQRFTRAEATPDKVVYRRLLDQPATATTYYVKEIVEHRYSDNIKLWQGWLRGEISYVPGVSLWDLKRYRGLSDTTLHAAALPMTHVLHFHPRSRPLGFSSLRRALAYGVDREKILRENLLRDADSSLGRVVSGPWATGLNATNSLVKPHPYDPRLALAMLLAAKKELKEDIPPLKLGVSSDPFEKIAAQSLIEQWKQLGVTVTLVEVGPQIPFDPAATPAPWDLYYRSHRILDPLVEIWPFLTLETGARVEALTHLPHWLRQELIELDSVGDWPSAQKLLRKLHLDLHAEVFLLPLWEISEFSAVRKPLRGVPATPLVPYQDCERWQWQPWFPKESL